MIKEAGLADLSRSNLYRGAVSLQAIDIHGEEAMMDIPCTRYQHLHTRLCVLRASFRGKALPLSCGSEAKILDMATSMSAAHGHSELYFLRVSSTPHRHGNKFYTYDKILKIL